MSASFSHKVAYWTKKMGISSTSASGSAHGGGGPGNGSSHHPSVHKPRPEGRHHHHASAPSYSHQQQPAAQRRQGQVQGGQQQYATASHHGGTYQKQSHRGGHHPGQHHQQQQQRHQHQHPQYIGGHHQTTIRNTISDMDESDSIYHTAAQGMAKMAVDSRDEDQQTAATASTAAATHSYSLDDGSTVVSENGTEMIMGPKLGSTTNSVGSYGSHGSRGSRGTTRGHTPYNAHSFKAGSHTFTVDTKYSLIRVIGSGAYGVVISAQDTSLSNRVAIKMVPRAFHDEVDAKRILREIKLLKHFRHENIVSIVDMMPPLARHVEDFNDVYIVAELMETDLHRIIYSKQALTIDHVQYFLYQILRALKYIHSANVLHRDLKPSNLLVNSNCDLKVCDFGLARGVLPEEEMGRAGGGSMLLTEYVVTRWYRAPEIMLACHEYAKPIDVWSVGCIFAELLGRKPFFPGDDYIDQLTLITEKLGKLPEEDLDFVTSEKARRFMRKLPDKPPPSLRRQFPGTPHDALDLLGRMLQVHPQKRITVQEALEHPFLEPLHSPDDEPVADETFDFTFEEEKLNRVRLQELIWEEIGDFRPGCLPVPPRRDGSRGGSARSRRLYVA